MNPTVLLTAAIIFACLNVGLLAGIIVKWLEKPTCMEKKVTQQERTVGGSKRIVGGSRVNINDFPFMAAIVVKKHGVVPKDSLQCGSCIISPKWILTAAHCLTLLQEQGFEKDKVFISTGSVTWGDGKRYEIANWIYHEKFDTEVMNDDIALINVEEPIKGINARPIPLASRRYAYKGGTRIKVIGWGLHDSDDAEVQLALFGVDVILYNQTYCKKLYDLKGQAVTRSMFCAGVPRGGKDACQFDSGGPIFEKNILIGIVSWGIDCGKKDQPGVYTRVGMYQRWIVQKTKELKDPIEASFKHG